MLPSRTLQYLKEIIPHADLQQIKSLIYAVNGEKGLYTIKDFDEAMELLNARFRELAKPK